MCSHAFSVFQLKQGSVATLIRWGRWNLYRHVCCSFLNLTVKTALKLLIFDEVTDTTIFMALNVWRSLICILFVALASGKVKLWLWKTQTVFFCYFMATLTELCCTCTEENVRVRGLVCILCRCVAVFDGLAEVHWTYGWTLLKTTIWDFCRCHLGFCGY